MQLLHLFSCVCTSNCQKWFLMCSVQPSEPLKCFIITLNGQSQRQCEKPAFIERVRRNILQIWGQWHTFSQSLHEVIHLDQHLWNSSQLPQLLSLCVKFLFAMFCQLTLCAFSDLMCPHHSDPCREAHVAMDPASFTHGNSYCSAICH